MDAELIERFRKGEASAATAMRNQLRTIAGRVLAAPNWHLELNAEEARRLELESANEALASKREDAVGFAVEALAAGARRALTQVRHRDAVHGEHPPVGLVVGVAMETASAAQAAQLTEHSKGCGHCKRHLELVRHSLKAATSAQALPPAPPDPMDAPEPAAAMQGAPQAAKPAPKASPKPTAKRRPPRKAKEGTPLWVGLLGIALIVGGPALIWHFARPQDPLEAQYALQATLPRELPSGARASYYTGATRAAIEQMARGDCDTAAHRFTIEHKRQPDDPFFAYAEGMAWVCARKGDKAVGPLGELAASGKTPWGFDWWWAQALVLDGQTDLALEVLDRLAASKHKRAADAKAFAERVRALEDS